jgi:hypothetical protein
MSLLYEMEKYGLADCEQNRSYINSRKFMVQDIMAMQQLKPEQVQFLEKVNDDGIYKLWRDLVNLTLSEQLNNE